MDIREIEVVCQLTNYKNFADAAYSLCYSPSVITKYVSNIEKELGIKLFIRSRKSNDLMITPEGKVLLVALKRISDDYQYMKSLADQLTSFQEKKILIGSQARLGNVQEQEIIARFLADRDDTEIEMVKTNAQDLVSLLRIGKLDAVFLTLHKNLDIAKMLHDLDDREEINYIYLGYDDSMYFGISEKYLPGIMEAPFKEFKDFTFALPFRKHQDVSHTYALSTFDEMAAQNGFKLKTMLINGHDNSLLKLATMKPIVISAANNETMFNGLKFVKVTDWPGGTNKYFVYRKSNKKNTFIDLKKKVIQYVKCRDTEDVGDDKKICNH